MDSFSAIPHKFTQIYGSLLAGICTSTLFLTLVGCTNSGATQKDQPVVLRIASASDLKFAFEDLRSAFQVDHPQITLEPTFGASGTFFAQITQHAPFDLFLSADENYPQQLVDQGLVRGEKFPYAEGHLVLWASKKSSIEIDQLGMKSLTDPRVRKIAIANPRTAPYGRAAEEVLKHEQLLSQLESKIVLGENAAQTTQFAESENVDLAFIPLSHALSKSLKEKGNYWQISDQYHKRIIQVGVILQSGKHQEAAESFRDFLISPAGRKILARYGLQSRGD